MRSEKQRRWLHQGTEGFRSQVSRDNNGGMRIAADTCEPHWKFSGFTWYAIVFVHRPLPKHWQSTRPLRLSTCTTMKLARKERRPGAWEGGLWLQASKRWNKNGIKWCTRGVRDLWDLTSVGRMFRCRASASFQKSHWNGMETRWKWEWGGCADTCKAREKIQYKYLAISCFGMFWRKFTVTLTRDLGFKILAVDMSLC